MRWGILLMAALALLAGCGGGQTTVMETNSDDASEAPPPSNLVPVIALTPKVVKRCLTEGEATVVSVESLAPAGSLINAKGVFALGPDGGLIGIVFDAQAVHHEPTREGTRSDGQHEIRKTRDGRAIIVLAPNASSSEEALAAECVEV